MLLIEYVLKGGWTRLDVEIYNVTNNNLSRNLNIIEIFEVSGQNNKSQGNNCVPNLKIV